MAHNFRTLPLKIHIDSKFSTRKVDFWNPLISLPKKTTFLSQLINELLIRLSNYPKSKTKSQMCVFPQRENFIFRFCVINLINFSFFFSF